MHINDLITGQFIESIRQHYNYDDIKPIGFKDLSSGKIYSYCCTKRIDKFFVKEKEKMIKQLNSSVDNGNFDLPVQTKMNCNSSKVISESLENISIQIDLQTLLQIKSKKIEELQNNLFLNKINSEMVNSNLVLNDQINKTLMNDLSSRGIRLEDLNPDHIIELLQKKTEKKSINEHEAEFDPFYYFKNELDENSVKDLKSSNWNLNPNFLKNFTQMEDKYLKVIKLLSKQHS